MNEERYQVTQCHFDAPGDSWQLVDIYTGEQLDFGLFCEATDRYREALKECTRRNKHFHKLEKLWKFYMETPKKQTDGMTYDEVMIASGVNDDEH